MTTAPSDDSVARPCAGIRVLDLASGHAAIAGMILADYGADVVRVVHPARPARSAGGPEPLGAANLQWQRGKRTLSADLGRPDERAAVHRLVAEADVVVENFRPGSARRLGVDWETLRELNEDLVVLSVTGFGPGSALSGVKAYEGVVAAACGQFVIQNGYRDGPIYDAVCKGAFGAAMLGLIGVLAALRHRDAGGGGQHVATSLVQSLFVYSYDGLLHPDASMTRAMSIAQGPDPHNTAPGYRIAQCKDGRWIQSGSYGPGIFENLMRALGVEEYFTDPRFARGVWSLDDEGRRALIDLIDAAYRTRTLEEWMARFDEYDAAYGVFLTTQEFMDYPQVVHNGHVVTVEDPTVGTMRQIGPLATFRGSPWRWPGAAEPDASAASAVEWRPRARRTDFPVDARPPLVPPRQGALADLVIVDLANYAAAPGGPGLLADLGALVVKVEPPDGDPISRKPGELFIRMTRSKRRVAIDLKDAHGQEALHALVAGADVVVHNFRPGVPERLAVDFESLRAVNDRIVYVYGAAFGSTGPDCRRPAFDPVISAMAGGEVLQAGHGNPPQQRQTADHSALLGVGAAILLGLRERDRTGHAVSVETTMLCSAAYLFSDDFVAYPGKPPRPVPDAGQHGIGPLYRLYEAADGWVFLACPREDEWDRLVKSLDPGLAADPRFADASARAAHADELAGSLAAILALRPAAEWERDLCALDVACVRADDTWPHFLYGAAGSPARVDPRMVVEYHVPDVGTVRHTGAAIDMSVTPATVGCLERLGQSTVELLLAAGVEPERLEELMARGVVRAT